MEFLDNFFSKEPEGVLKEEVIREVDTNLDTNFELSGIRLLELQKGRDIGDIPLDDEYWIALANHRLHHGHRG